ncbi:MAG: hypothetical protein F6K55_23120, partial [Moorea sp. SIO4A3]|nr:hypothetical protein [Moorena sp. SIO4A3]
MENAIQSSLFPLASCLLPLAFPSWEGLGVGSSCLLPTPCSLLPVPCSLFPIPYSLFPIPSSLSPLSSKTPPRLPHRPPTHSAPEPLKFLLGHATRLPLPLLPPKDAQT